MQNKKYKRLAKGILGTCIVRNGECIKGRGRCAKDIDVCKHAGKPCWDMQFNIKDLSDIKVHGIREIEKQLILRRKL